VSNRLTYIDFKLSEMEILAQPLSLPFIIENLNIWAGSTQQFNFKRSKIDKEDEEIYLKELCELENLVCTKTVYTPENGQLEKVFFRKTLYDGPPCTLLFH
jgi:hypothetical protein